MSAKVGRERPEWVLDIAGDTIWSGESALMQRMLDAGEDVTDTALWKHRRSQFMSLLAGWAAER